MYLSHLSGMQNIFLYIVINLPSEYKSDDWEIILSLSTSSISYWLKVQEKYKLLKSISIDMFPRIYYQHLKLCLDRTESEPTLETSGKMVCKSFGLLHILDTIKVNNFPISDFFLKFGTPLIKLTWPNISSDGPVWCHQED